MSDWHASKRAQGRADKSPSLFDVCIQKARLSVPFGFFLRVSSDHLQISSWVQFMF